MPKLDPLAPSEWKIMKIIWNRKSCATRDVIEAAQNESDWTPSTIKTLLRRLVEKGYLKTQQVGSCFLYRPTQPALKVLLHMADELLNRAVEGTVGPVLAHMVKRGRLSKDEIAELRSMLNEYDKNEEKPK